MTLNLGLGVWVIRGEQMVGLMVMKKRVTVGWKNKVVILLAFTGWVW